jgi:hypothetical protein
MKKGKDKWHPSKEVKQIFPNMKMESVLNGTLFIAKHTMQPLKNPSAVGLSHDILN